MLLLAVLVLAGWHFDIEPLRKMGSPLVAMNPVTAICFLFGAVSFLLIRKAGDRRLPKAIGLLLTVLLLAIAVNRLLGLAFGWEFPIDELLYTQTMSLDLVPGRPGRMSFNTSFCFFLLGLALVQLGREGKPNYRASQLLALMIGLLSLLSLLSYLYQTGSFFGMLSYIPMALNTAIAFFVFSLAILFAYPDKGLMQQMTTHLSGGLTARVLLPAAVLLPTFFGLLRLWGHWRGFYDNEFGVTLFSLVTIISLGAIAWYSAVSLNKREAEQLHTQQQLLNSREEIAAIFRNAPDAIVVIDREGNIVKWNPESTKLFGWEETEVLGRPLTEIIIPEELREAHKAGMARFTTVEKSKIVGQTVELWGVHRSGRHIDLALRISPVILDNKTFFVGFIRDITEKKAIEKQLQRFNEELSKQVVEKTQETREILDRIHDGFVALDRNFVYTYANNKIGELTGKDLSELIGKNVWEVFPAAVGTPVYNAFMHAIENQEYVLKTDYYEPLDLWQEYHIYPSANGLSVFIRDISEQVRSEKEILKVRSLADTLIDSLPGVFYFYDDTGKFIRWNRQFEEMTGYSSEEIAGMHPSQFFADDEKEYIIQRIQGVFEKGQNDAEANLLHKNGSKVPHYFRAIKMEYDGKQCLLGYGIDMRDKKKDEEKLKLSEQKYRLLFHSNPLAMWMLSLPEYRMIEANESALIQYGYSRQEFLQLDIASLRPEEDRHKFNRSTNTNFRGIHYAGIWRHKKKDDTVIFVNIVTHDTWYEEKPVRLVLANEVTEQYLAEERLKESYQSIKRLTEHLNQVREQERLHIAREIHDELGQLLTVLKMDVSWLNRKIRPEPGPVKDKLSDLQALLDNTVKTVRRISSELRPSLIDDLGLVAAMEWHIEEFSKRSGIICQTDLPTSEMLLPDSIKIGLYRILQESLTNVARHAQAKIVKVKLHNTDNQLILRVQDDGVGFDESKRKKKTLGLIGARERAEALGGTYFIGGETGKGTLVLVQIPWINKSETEKD